MLMKKFKMVIIGGASMAWTPKLVNDCLLIKDLEETEIVLVDIDTEKLPVIKTIVEKLAATKNQPVRFTTCVDYRDALPGADIVLTTCLIGGHAAWRDDLNIALRYGIEHPKGMSVGPGGLIQGLKNAAAIVDIAKDMERLCPQAWLLNYTNPMQTISLALAKYSSIRSMGLCHGVTECITWISEQLGIPEAELNYRAFGINHCGWLFSLKMGNQDLMPILREVIDRTMPLEKERWEGQEIATREMWDLFGAFPMQTDIHTIEFFYHYYNRNRKLADYSLQHNYVEKRMQKKNEQWEKMQKIARGELPLKTCLELTTAAHTQFDKNRDLNLVSKEKIDKLVQAIIGNRETVLYVNTLNNGCIPNLPDDCCVEIPARINSAGFDPCYMGPLPDGIAGLMNIHAYVQKLTVEAAMKGDRQLALQALYLDPITSEMSMNELGRLLDDLLEANKVWLPRFYR